MITVDNLWFRYSEENDWALKGLSLEVKKGEFLCVLGSNGCGKSTLLRTLAGLQPAIGGTFEIQNTKSNIQNSTALVLTERLSLENTTIHDVVAMGRYPYTSFLGGLSDEDEQVVSQALANVGLEGTEDSFFNAHSDGEKQRALIAKAIAQETPIILLDEPTAHLDLPNRIKILQLLRRLAHEQGKTILISTHELDLAIQLSDRILLMSKHGIQLDTANNLREKNAFTEAFGMDIFHPLNSNQ